VKPRQIKIATGQGQAITNGQAASQAQAADDGQHAQPAAVESK
jgi:hypothetical protein